MIEYSDESTKKDIVNRILNNPGMKKKEGFTKHVISFIEKLNIENKNENKFIWIGVLILFYKYVRNINSKYLWIKYE